MVKNRLLVLTHSKFLLSNNIVFDAQLNSSDATRRLLFVERGAEITLFARAAVGVARSAVAGRRRLFARAAAVGNVNFLNRILRVKEEANLFGRPLFVLLLLNLLLYKVNLL